MIIGSVRHKGLRRLIEDDNAAGVPAAVADKLRVQITFLEAMVSVDELLPILWKAHQLTGDRRGTWAFFVTRNWRLTFRIDGEPPKVLDLDFEDYH